MGNLVKFGESCREHNDPHFYLRADGFTCMKFSLSEGKLKVVGISNTLAIWSRWLNLIEGDEITVEELIDRIEDARSVGLQSFKESR